jgi:protocatechuate 3,4-dioxygenase beta subunit
MVWVIDEAGQPQALASVLLESVDRTWKRTDVADHHGRATFMRIPTGRYHASADVAGFTSDAILLDVTKAPATTHSIVVHPQHAPPTTPAGLGPATLWVIDEAGHPQAFADVTLESVDRTSERSALADEHGSVMFSDVPTGRYHASARLAGFTSDVILVDATKAPATTHSIVVHPEHAAAATTPREAGSATLWVIDETGKPRPSVEVILAPVGDGVKVSMTTDAAGRVVLTGLPPGRYHATASLRRFTSDTVVVDASDAPVRAYSIVVHPSHRHGSRETR